MAGPDEQPPSSIAERIVGGSSGIDEAIGTRAEDEGGGAEGGASEPAPLTTESVEALLAERLTPLQESLAEKDQEIAYLRGAQAEQSRQIQAPRGPQTAPPERPKSYLESTPKEQALRDLETNPLETLARIIDDKLSPLVAKLNGVDGTLNRSAQERAFETAAQADLTELNETYGHLKDHPSFGKEADVEFNKLKVAEGGYQPGMLTRASARVFARLAKAGQITASSNGGATSVSRSFRNGNSHDAGNSSGAGGGEGGRGGDPKSISDLQASGQLTATDAAAAKKVMSKLGVSEADYVRRLNLARKDNPRFGER